MKILESLRRTELLTSTGMQPAIRWEVMEGYPPLQLFFDGDYAHSMWSSIQSGMPGQLLLSTTSSSVANCSASTASLSFLPSPNPQQLPWSRDIGLCFSQGSLGTPHPRPLVVWEMQCRSPFLTSPVQLGCTNVLSALKGWWRAHEQLAITQLRI